MPENKDPFREEIEFLPSDGSAAAESPDDDSSPHSKGIVILLFLLLLLFGGALAGRIAGVAGHAFTSLMFGFERGEVHLDLNLSGIEKILSSGLRRLTMETARATMDWFDENLPDIDPNSLTEEELSELADDNPALAKILSEDEN